MTWNAIDRIVRYSRALAGPLGLAIVLTGLCGIARGDERVPEIDAGAMSSALSLLCGGLLILGGRRRPR